MCVGGVLGCGRGTRGGGDGEDVVVGGKGVDKGKVRGHGGLDGDEVGGGRGGACVLGLDLKANTSHRGRQVHRPQHVGVLKGTQNSLRHAYTQQQPNQKLHGLENAERWRDTGVFGFPEEERGKRKEEGGCERSEGL